MIFICLKCIFRTGDAPVSQRSWVRFPFRPQLIMLNYPVILSHRRSTTLSLESYPFFQPPSRYNCGDVVILSTQVYQWWKSTKRVPYPSTLYVTLKGVQPPKTIDPSLRSMFAIQQVCLFFFFFSFLCEHCDRYGEHSGHYKLPTEMCSVEFKHYKENSCNTETLKLVANIYFLFEKL